MATHIFVDTGFGEEFQELELSQSSKTKQGMIEREDLLNRNLSLGGLVEGSSNCSIGAFADSM
jgi:hypothetical protein